MLRAVIFDVNGTLTDTAPLGAPWGRPELGDRILQAAVSTAMVDALLKVGDRPFADHLRAALEVVAGDEGLDPASIPTAANAGSSLPAHPGAAAALEMLAQTGLQIVALTNSGTSAGRQTLKSAQLDAYFDDVIGVDAVASFVR